MSPQRTPSFPESRAKALSLEVYVKRARREILNTIPVEERLEGLTIEERLRGLTTEGRLRGLSFEERLSVLCAEIHRRELAAEGRAEEPVPITRVEGLSRDERLALLADLKRRLDQLESNGDWSAPN